jgi:hypothetical protein
LLHEPALRILRGFKARDRAKFGAKPGAKLRDRCVAAIVQVHRDSLHRLSLVKKTVPLFARPDYDPLESHPSRRRQASSKYVHEFIDMQQ